MPISCSTMARRPGGDLFARSDDRVIFAGIMDGGRFAAPADQPVGRAGHGRDHDGDLMAGFDLALDMARHIADALDIGNRGPPEFHHQTAHGPSLFITRRASSRPGHASSSQL